jgi:2,3-bisphosphoglycerate-independent phosphoglycerate mutase
MEIDGVRFYLKPGVEHRCALIMRGAGLSPDVSDVDPHVEGAHVLESQPRSSSARRTATLLNKFTKRSYDILSVHKMNAVRRQKGLLEANIILARGAGVVPHLPSLRDRTGMRGLCIAGIPIIKGIGRLAGLDAPSVKGATGSRDTDLDAKFGAFVKKKSRYDFFLINVKGTDVCGHDGDFDGKVEFIERVDVSLGKVSKSLSDVIFAVTGDHSTPVTVRDHSGDPLPLCISGETVRRDGVAGFDEVSCARGGLGRIRGKDILPILMDLADRSEKFGA